MPGPLHSAEHVAHIWVGSSQPLRRTCLPLASGAWPVQLCSHVYRPRKVTTGGRALAYFACDIGILVQQHLSSMDVNELCSYFYLSTNTSCLPWQQIQLISGKVNAEWSWEWNSFLLSEVLRALCFSVMKGQRNWAMWQIPIRLCANIIAWLPDLPADFFGCCRQEN